MGSRCLLKMILISMTFMSLSVRSFSQDKALLSRADSLHQLGRDLFAEQKYKDAIVFFEKAAEIRKEQLGDYSAVLANSINNIGVCYYHLGDYTEAIDCHQRAAAIQEKISGKENRNY